MEDYGFIDEGPASMEDLGLFKPDLNFIKDIQINLSDKWKKVNGFNGTINNGAYIVTLENKVGQRTIDMATYINGVWALNRYNTQLWTVIAYIDDISTTLIPFEGNIQKFKKGDVIVWHDNNDIKKTIMCWMVIGSFDYESDRAARAQIGKSYFSQEIQTIYNSWVPNNFGEDVRLATDTEVNIICDELATYYKTNFIMPHGNMGPKMLKNDLEGLRPDLYLKVLNLV